MLTSPYVVGGRTLAGGLDCWGLVEVWHSHLLKIELACRNGGTSSAHFLRAFVATKDEFLKITKPQNHAVVVMTANHNGRMFAGHCGTYWNGNVIHTEAITGCTIVPYKSVQHRVAGYYLHPEALRFSQT